jgi:predicted ATPase
MLRKLIIKNFKIHKNTSIQFDQKLSLVTGENNTGKTSLLESISIFRECIGITLHEIQRKNEKMVKSGLLQVGDFNLKDSYTLGFDSIRSTDCHELFYQEETQFQLDALIKNATEEIWIGFQVAKSSGGSFKVIPTIKERDLRIFNDVLYNNELIDVVRTSPLSYVTEQESFFSPAVIKKMTARSNTLGIFRNRIRQLEGQNKLQDLQIQITNILDLHGFEIRVSYDQNQDEYVTVDFRTDSVRQYQDIAALGSGTLQLIEVLISLNLKKDNLLNLILLDEPDSHLHRKAQRGLVNELRRLTNKNVQVIATTHNEQLVGSAHLNEILHLELTEQGTINTAPLATQFESGRIQGLVGQVQTQNIYQSLGVSASVMDFIEAIESERLILVEGRSDANYIQALLQKKSTITIATQLKQYSYWSLGGVGELSNKLKYWQDILQQINNGKSLWDKAVLVLDKDHCTIQEMSELSEKIEEKHKIKMLYWKSYTFESTILSDVKATANVLGELLKKKPDQIEQDIQEEVMRISIDYKKKKTSIEHQRKERSKDFKGILGKDPNYSSGIQYEKYLNEIDFPNRKEMFFTKNEVETIIKGVCRRYEVVDTFDLESFIVKMIEAWSAKNWLTQWDDVLERLLSTSINDK